MSTADLGSKPPPSSSSSSPSSIWERAWALPRAHPFVTNLCLATLNASGADLLTQTAVEPGVCVDWSRTGVFALFGLTYLGGVQWLVHVKLYAYLFPTMTTFTQLSFAEKLRHRAGLWGAAKQVAFDVGFHLPFMYFPAFYTLKAALQQTRQDAAASKLPPSPWAAWAWACLQEGHVKYRANFWSDVKAMALVWVPADVVVFAVPLWLRLPTRHCVSFGWNAYLSFTRGAAAPELQPQPTPPQRAPSPPLPV